MHFDNSSLIIKPEVISEDCRNKVHLVTSSNPLFNMNTIPAEININHTWIKRHQFEITIKVKLSNIIKHPWPCYLGETNSVEVVRIKLHSTDYLFQSFKNLMSGSNNSTAHFLSTHYQAFQLPLNANNFLIMKAIVFIKLFAPRPEALK